MPTSRVNVSWANFPGAPGVSSFYYKDVPTQAEVDALRTFFNSLNAYLPAGLTTQVPASGDAFDELTGKLAGTWTVGTQPAVSTASGAGNYAGNAGAVVHWLSSGVVNGHRVRGRTFLVPLVSSAFDFTGSLGTTALAAIQASAVALVASMSANGVVWSRPFHDPTGQKPNRVGSTWPIVSSRVPDLAISLRSRRI